MFLIKRYDIKTTGSRDIVRQPVSLTQKLRYLFIYFTWDGEYFDGVHGEIWVSYCSNNES